MFQTTNQIQNAETLIDRVYYRTSSAILLQAQVDGVAAMRRNTHSSSFGDHIMLGDTCT